MVKAGSKEPGLSKTRQERDRQGLCYQCGEPTSINPITRAPYKYCDYHHSINNQNSKKYKAQLPKKHRSAGAGTDGLLSRYRPNVAKRYMHPCPECGIEVHNDFYYCPWCGAELEKEE